MTTIIDTGLLAVLDTSPTGPPPGGDPDLNTGAGYWAAFTHAFPGGSLDTMVWAFFGTITVKAQATAKVESFDPQGAP